jgi:hypothetical protein
MPTPYSIALPNATMVIMDLLAGVTDDTGAAADIRTAPPPDFSPPLLVVKRVGGTPDEDGLTDRPIVLVAAYGANFPGAVKLQENVQIRVLTSPLTMVDGVLIDTADIYVGEEEIPDVYPDERRIVVTYQFSWRRPWS